MPVADLCEPLSTAGRSAMPGPRSLTMMTNDCGARIAGQTEFDLPAAGVFEGVAGDFRHRGGDAGLILTFEADQLRQPARALADQDDVGLGADRDQEQARVHARNSTASVRMATTEASSRPRRQSRSSTPAISDGCWVAEAGIGGEVPSRASGHRNAG